MSEGLLPGDIRQVDNENYLLMDDVLQPNLGDSEDIGDFDPGDDFDESDLDVEIDDLPDVGEQNEYEEPILDELEEHDGLTEEEIAEFDKGAGVSG